MQLSSGCISNKSGKQRLSPPNCPVLGLITSASIRTIKNKRHATRRVNRLLVIADSEFRGKCHSPDRAAGTTGANTPTGPALEWGGAAPKPPFQVEAARERGTGGAARRGVIGRGATGPSRKSGPSRTRGRAEHGGMPHCRRVQIAKQTEAPWSFANCRSWEHAPVRSPALRTT